MNVKKILHCGNRKLSNDTMIFNVCPAIDCPAAKLGLCKLGKKCYALKAERLYPEVLPYRQRQAEYWQNTDSNTIISDFCSYIEYKRIKVRYFRYNESGDFSTIDDIRKLYAIANFLHRKYRIITFGYSARVDLMEDYLKYHILKMPKYFIVKLSGHKIMGLNSTCVIEKGESVPENYHLCPGKNCMSKCKKCIQPVNVAFRKH